MSILELLVILLVALVVIKPERLPEISYFLGRILGRFKQWQQHMIEKYNHWT